MANERNALRPPEGLLCYLGMGFWQTWWVVSMCDSLLLPSRQTFLEPFNPVYAVTVFTTLAYLAVALYGRKASILSHRHIYLVMAVLAFAGSLGMGFYGFLPQPGSMQVVYFFFTIVFSIGNALLIVSWGERWSTLATSRVGRHLYASYSLAFLFYFCITALPEVPGKAITSMLPVFSTIALSQSRNEPRRRPGSAMLEVESFPGVRIFVSLFAIGAVHGFVQAFLNSSFSENSTVMAPALIVACILLVSLILGLVVSKPTVEAFSLYRVIVPAFTVGLILLCALPSEYYGFGNGFLLFAIYSTDILVMLVSTDVAFRAKKSPAMCFGIAIFAMRFGTTASGFFTYRIVLSGTSEIDISLVLYCAIVIIVVVGSVLFTAADLMGMYRLKPEPASDGLFEEKCQSLANAYGLTPRETEVLQLLASGRSTPYISEKLVISENTVKHHISSIYRKMGVVGRQELIDVATSGDVQ